jgi:hypothetical protein
VIANYLKKEDKEENRINVFDSYKKIHSSVMKNTNAKYPATNAYMEFDIWIPEHSLCFEFQVCQICSI